MRSMDLTSSTVPFYGSLKRYWGRRHYQRLNVTARKTRTVRLGGKREPSPHYWRNVKLVTKLKLAWKVVSPIRLLGKLRDAYINLMLGLAGNVGSLNTDNVFGQKRVPKARKISNNKASTSKEEAYENKLVFEIYKALKASQQYD